MDELINIATVPAIVAIVYAVSELIKQTFNSEKVNRFIPLISCIVGIVCSIVAFFFVPESIPTDNFVVAVILGASSGLSATGFHQIFKQIKK